MKWCMTASRSPIYISNTHTHRHTQGSTYWLGACNGTGDGRQSGVQTTSCDIWCVRELQQSSRPPALPRQALVRGSSWFDDSVHPSSKRPSSRKSGWMIEVLGPSQTGVFVQVKVCEARVKLGSNSLRPLRWWRTGLFFNRTSLIPRVLSPDLFLKTH